MAVKWLNKLLSLLTDKDDRFLVVEIFENDNRASYIKANFASKELRVLKTASASSLKKLLNNFRRLKKYKIILGLDSHIASTIYSSAVIVRDNYKELINEPELDNLISQAIWKFFDRQRGKVAAKMGVSDLDILLADVKIRGVKLDGHKVVNPAGFKAKTVEIQFSQTFLRRDFSNSLKDLLPLNQVVLMSENGTAYSNVVAKSGPENDFLLANIFNAKTSLFLTEGSQNNYWDRFSWGEDDINRSLSDDLAIDPVVARQIITKYAANDFSPTFRRRLEVLLMKEFHTLARGLNSAMKRLDAKVVYVHPFFELPNLFGGSFKNNFDRPVAVKLLTADLISENFGFDIKFKNDKDKKQIFGLLAMLMEWYLAPREDNMSKLANRRVRWLSPL